MNGLAAVVVAGGAGRRLGGVDKPALVIGSTSLLDHAITALAAADPIVVVGPIRPTCCPVRWTVEDPPGGGPVAALAAGLAALGPDAVEVAVLAADLPDIDAHTIDRLRTALAEQPEADGALLVDEGGKHQWLTSVWRHERLREALPADPAGAALRAVFAPLEVVAVTARPGETQDVDTPDDLDRARRRASGAG